MTTLLLTYVYEITNDMHLFRPGYTYIEPEPIFYEHPKDHHHKESKHHGYTVKKHKVKDEYHHEKVNQVQHAYQEKENIPHYVDQSYHG